MFLEEYCYLTTVVIKHAKFKLILNCQKKKKSKSLWYYTIRMLSKFFVCKYTINKTILNILLKLFLQCIQDLKLVIYA